MKKAYLILGNGEILEGEQIGAEGRCVGELVFTTGMEGYLETLTDPSYAGQIVIQTFPLIGNYGVIEEDFEGTPALRGYIVRECCDEPSNFRSQYPLDRYLKSRGICGISGLDTRYLTTVIREGGVLNAMITDTYPDDLPALLEELSAYTVKDAVASVSRKKPEVFPADGETRFRVTLLDYGAKQNIIRSLCSRGCEVTAMPHDTPAETILAASPDGIMLSNGPGDPAENTFCIGELTKLIGKLPIFGICLGHQLTALAMGGKTEKLLYGHRGGNQPVHDLLTGRTYITSQNHGYAVISDSLAGVGQISFINANDGSCEGILYPGKQCFTVQFHPEACSGPKDTAFLFDRFISMMEETKHAKG